jgi:benzaldehyde dehydrogenase (NAD)
VDLEQQRLLIGGAWVEASGGGTFERSDPLTGEEASFGPVVTIVPVDWTEEAIETANDTEYGLSAAVFSEDVDQAMEVARRIESGICHINSATVHDEPQVPFGGVKASGWGRFGGKAALEEFTELRWMTIRQGARHYPI